MAPATLNSSRPINTSPVISPITSFISCGGNIRIQLDIADT
ncbi:hypothetical protein PS682_05367 [Pseudomonas fluorescens]|nr:hypothetical protein PS682_05367 [Pseudomonas fluorescens]VVN44207.1 hypothetical protein PS663_05661 [Pseudomonas fluorescens]